jgi:hypothetical protein
MQKSAHQTYTIPLRQKHIYDVSFRNLIIDVYNNNATTLLMTYTPDANYLANHAKGIHGKFTGKAKLELYEVNNNGSGLHVQSLKTNVVEICYNVDVYLGSDIHMCSCNEHWPWQINQCTCPDSGGTYPWMVDYYTNINICYEETFGGGGGSGGTGGSPGGTGDGGGGGTPPTTPPDYDPCPPVNVASSGLKVQYAEGPPPCVPPVTPPVVYINPLDTISEASLRANVKANCIYQSLKSNPIFKEFILGYLANPTYNLSFKVGPLADTTNGNTVYNSNYTNGKVVITINENQIDNRFAMDVAKTYIHEAYHAYITQMLIQYGGPLGLHFSRPDFNKELNEIFDAYIQYGVDLARSEASKRGLIFDDSAAQHAIMAAELDKIAIGVRYYIESKFPAIINNPNITLDNYRAVAWQGLEKTDAFKRMWGTPNNPTLRNLILTLRTNTTYDCQ